MANYEVTCITYGKGNVLNRSLIAPVKNESWKPSGGLWSSPTTSSYQWKHYCMEQGHRVEELSNSFTFTFVGRLLQIRCQDDWSKLPVYKKAINEWLPMSPDWEYISQHYQGVYVSSSVIHTLDVGCDGKQFKPAINIGEWDCSTLLVFDSSSIY